MARKRLVSPELFLHGELFDAEQESGLPLRLAFIGLWTQADRRGLFAWKPRELKLHVLPHDAVNMADTMSALCRHGFVEYYEVEGKGYGRIPNFHRWQTFHVRERPDLRIPEPLTGSTPMMPQGQARAGTVLAPCSPSASTTVSDAVAVADAGTIAGAGAKELNAAFAAPAPLLLLPEAAPLTKPPKAKKAPRDEGAGETGKPKYPHFPMPLCLEMHALWVSKFGAVTVSDFRKEFGPLFTIAEADRPATAPTNAELRDALKSYADLAPMGDGAAFATVRRAAAVLSAIANTRREYAQEPERRLDAIMRIIHGRNGRAAA
jgi:hypothetical protein